MTAPGSARHTNRAARTDGVAATDAAMSPPPLTLHRALPVGDLARNFVRLMGASFNGGIVAVLITTSIAPRVDAWVLLAYLLLAYCVISFVQSEYIEYASAAQTQLLQRRRALLTARCDNEGLYTGLVATNFSSGKQIEAYVTSIEAIKELVSTLLFQTVIYNILTFSDGSMMNAYEVANRIIFVFMLFVCASVYSSEGVREHHDSYHAFIRERCKARAARAKPGAGAPTDIETGQRPAA